MTFREIMRMCSKLRDDQLDYEANIYVRDLDKNYELDSFQISKKETDMYDEEQPFMVI